MSGKRMGEPRSERAWGPLENPQVQRLLICGLREAEQEAQMGF